MTTQNISMIVRAADVAVRVLEDANKLRPRDAKLCRDILSAWEDVARAVEGSLE